MNRFGLALLGVSLLASSEAFAQKASAVVSATKPALVCPQAEMGNVDQQAKYDTMWQEYSKSVEDASRKLRDEIETQTKSATSAGNLDLALFWKALAKDFELKGELRWDDTSLKKSWSDRFGDSSYPTRFVVAVKKASQAFASATEDLEKGYGELVADFTKAENLEEALKIRGELKELLAGSSPTARPEPKPEPKPQLTPQNGKYRLVFNDGSGTGFLLERQDDILWIHGDIDPNKPNGVSVWPNPRAVPCRVVGGKLLTDDGDPAKNKWRCAIAWDTKTGEVAYLYDNYKGRSYQKRGKVAAGAW